MQTLKKKIQRNVTGSLVNEQSVVLRKLNDDICLNFR